MPGPHLIARGLLCSLERIAERMSLRIRYLGMEGRLRAKTPQSLKTSKSLAPRKAYPFANRAKPGDMFIAMALNICEIASLAAGTPRYRC